MIETGLKLDKILLPATDDLQSWACIACDQFTSEKEYWDELEKTVGDKKSKLKLTLPEIYLEDNAEERIAKINKNIKEYLSSGVFKALDNGFVLTVRKTPFVERSFFILVLAFDITFCLSGEKVAVLATKSHKLLVGTAFDNLSVFKNYDKTCYRCT